MRVNPISEQGLALLWVLVLLCVISIISLAGLQDSWMQQKIMRNIFHRETILWVANRALIEVEKKSFAVTSMCDVPQLSIDNILHQSINWWRSFPSCSGKIQGFQYYYRREKMAALPCSYIINISDTTKSNSVIFFRNTLLLQDTNHTEANIFLQSTTIAPGLFKPNCPVPLTVFSSVRQSWRELHTLRISDES